MTHARRAALAVAASLIAAPLDVATAAPFLLINESRSLPRGLYIRSRDPDPRLGRVVALPQPSRAARRYLARLGVPPGTWLLKRVAAVGGERVCARGGVLRTPRMQVPVPETDRRGIILPVWRGCRRLRPDELLLLGEISTSFDSRHFGPVRRGQIEGTYEEVLRW